MPGGYFLTAREFDIAEGAHTLICCTEEAASPLLSSVQLYLPNSFIEVLEERRSCVPPQMMASLLSFLRAVHQRDTKAVMSRVQSTTTRTIALMVGGSAPNASKSTTIKAVLFVLVPYTPKQGLAEALVNLCFNEIASSVQGCQLHLRQRSDMGGSCASGSSASCSSIPSPAHSLSKVEEAPENQRGRGNVADGIGVRAAAIRGEASCGSHEASDGSDRGGVSTMARSWSRKRREVEPHLSQVTGRQMSKMA